MPEYTFKCPSCKEYSTLSLAIDDRNLPQQCGCGATLARTFVTQAFTAYDFKGYTSTVTGEYIDSLSAHKAHLAKTGMVEIADHNTYLAKNTGGKVLISKRDRKRELIHQYKQHILKNI
jgi:predicted nucleic acid-binding Zn ribbon protein